MRLVRNIAELKRVVAVRFALLHRSLRSSEASIIILCAPLGMVVGVLVYALRETIYAAHEFAFGYGPHGYLSEQTSIEAWRLILVPIGMG